MLVHEGTLFEATTGIVSKINIVINNPFTSLIGGINHTKLAKTYYRWVYFMFEILVFLDFKLRISLIATIIISFSWLSRSLKDVFI